jgi:hypothetical protein
VVTLVASSVTNSAIFRAEDFKGTTLSNNVDNRVIAMTLQFYQKEYGVATNSTTKSADFFQLRTRVTRRLML